MLGGIGWLYLGALVSYFGYFIVCEGLFGKTAGKHAAGVIVVRVDGTPITMRQAIVRNLLRFVDGFFSYAVGLVTMLLTDDRKRLGDVAADTLVVEER
ncbi:RDD family protein [Natrononativus amylolyticus]|uniref:RDD family protein n=1 Tax=Natrononativus amylolyticus TaxID=2963434 RepID=UPI0020CE4FAB|nr:RDD family protein [Natrononativus amylolyticus]